MAEARTLVAGAARGAALVLEEPLSFWGGYDYRTGEIIDRRHPLSGEIAAGCILCLPSTRGSSTTTAVLLEAVKAGTAPAAALPAGAVSPTSAGGTAAPKTMAADGATAHTAPPLHWGLILCYGVYGFGYILPATFLPAQARLLVPAAGDMVAVIGQFKLLYVAMLAVVPLVFFFRRPRAG